MQSWRTPALLLPNAEHLARNVGVCKHSNIRFHRHQLIMYVINLGQSVGGFSLRQARIEGSHFFSSSLSQVIEKDLPSLNLCACVRLVCVMV